MTTTTEKNHEQRVADLEGDIENLENRIRAARASAESASNRLQEVSRAMDEISPAYVAGGEQEQLDMLALEETHEQYSREQRVSRVAADQLRHQLQEKKEQLGEARREQARARFEELQGEVDESQERCLEAARQLKDCYQDLRTLHARMGEQAQLFMNESEALSVRLYGPPDAIRPQLQRTLRGLGL